MEREKVRIDIQYREKVVTDARLIADSLLQFGKVFRVLPPADQKELIRLLVKEVTVNHFDPEKDQMPSQPGVFKARIRTKWYLVNMTLYASDLFAGGSPKEGNKFVFDTAWLRRPQPNTNFELTSILMGIPFARWGARPFIVHPFRYPEAACHDIEARPDHETTSEPCILNPVRMAQEWQTMLTRDHALTKATIARNMGLSRARVTQIMNLLDLPEPIISVVAGLQKPTQIRIVSERKLRAILELTSKPAQLRAFALLQAELTRAS